MLCLVRARARRPLTHRDPPSDVAVVVSGVEGNVFRRVHSKGGVLATKRETDLWCQGKVVVFFRKIKDTHYVTIQG